MSSGALHGDETLAYHPRMGRQFWAALFACLVSLGCRSVEEDCKAMCDWADRCGDEPDDPKCFDDCVENMEDADDECRDALGDFAACAEDLEDCDDDECDNEAVILFGNCIDEFS